jgi:hypothetical protein
MFLDLKKNGNTICIKFEIIKVCFNFNSYLIKIIIIKIQNG